MPIPTAVQPYNSRFSILSHTMTIDLEQQTFSSLIAYDGVLVSAYLQFIFKYSIIVWLTLAFLFNIHIIMYKHTYYSYTDIYY